MASPNPGSASDDLYAAAANSATNVWAVGYYEPSGSTSAPLVEHFDGSTWSVASLPTSLTSLDGHFNSVGALATNNAWAVGDYYDLPTNRNHTLVAHWNGSTWSPVPSPDGSTFDRFYGIAATSATSIWATGDQYVCGSGPAGPLTEYWDGCQWRVVPAASANSFDNTLLAVAAGPMLSTPVAVGDYQYGATGAFEKTLTETLTGQTLHTLPSMGLCRATS